jgi:hypothetical protein
MRAILRSADGRNKFETAVSEANAKAIAKWNAMAAEMESEPPWNPIKPEPWWEKVPRLTTLSDRESASKATLKEMIDAEKKEQTSAIPAPEEPKKRLMRKSS